MNTTAPFRSIIDAIVLPTVIQVGPNLFLAAFRLMKLLPAHYILERARNEQRIRRGSLVVESSSGTFGHALAIVCRLRGYELKLVSDQAISPSFKRQIEDLRTSVEIVPQPAPIGGFQRARMEKLAAILADRPDAFWPQQYDNPLNPMAYGRAAERVVTKLGGVDALVGAVGSGGSTGGMARVLRGLHPHLRTLAVDTHGSVLFGLQDRPRALRGLGNSLMPQNVDHTVYDEVHWVTAAEAFRTTRELHAEHALFLGPTSGAAYLVAHWYAQQNPDATVLALCADEGHRYADTVYDDTWLLENGLWVPRLPAEPELVTHPGEVRRVWTRLEWGRRTYEQVVGTQFAEGQAA